MENWKEIPFTDIEKVRIGHAQDPENSTGCTVLVFPQKAPCGLDVRGGGPASRETQLLDPTASNDGVGTLAAYVLGKAINRAVLEAEPMFGLKAAKDMCK